MSFIFKAFYAHSIHNPLMLLPVLAMVLFMAVFLAAVVRAWRLQDPDRLQDLSALPLQDESTPISPRGGTHV